MSGDRIEINLGGEDSPENFKVRDYRDFSTIEITDEEVTQKMRYFHTIRESGDFEMDMINTGPIKIESATVAKQEGRPNQDAFIQYAKNEKFFVAGVLDGMGGIRGGYNASHYMREELLARLHTLSEHPKMNEVLQTIQGAADKVIERLDNEGYGPDENGHGGADTTMSLVFAMRDEQPNANGIHEYTVYFVNRGDSRVYMQDLATSAYGQITEDESQVNEVYKAGGISKLQAKVHPDRNYVLGGLRQKDQNPNKGTGVAWFPYKVTMMKVANPTEFIVTTDGMTDGLREDEEVDEMDMLASKRAHPVRYLAYAKIRDEQHVESLSKNDDVTVVKITVEPKAKVIKQAQPLSSSVPETAKPTPEQKERDLDAIWNEIEDNAGYKRLISECAFGDFNNGDNLVSTDLEEFYKKCPTAEAFERKIVKTDIINQLPGNKQAKYQRYVEELKKILY